jgi:hypothetical protein
LKIERISFIEAQRLSFLGQIRRKKIKHAVRYVRYHKWNIYIFTGTVFFTTFHLKLLLTKKVERIACVSGKAVKSIVLRLAFCLVERKILKSSCGRQ